jgi:hypothetical protein
MADLVRCMDKMVTGRSECNGNWAGNYHDTSHIELCWIIWCSSNFCLAGWISFFLPIIIAGTWYLWRSRKKRDYFANTASVNHLGTSELEWLLLLLFVLAALGRWWQIQGLIAPLWVDGLFHQELVERLLLPNSIANTFYHTGFHQLVASLTRLLHLPVPIVSLYTSQWLGALAGCTLYPLAKRLTHNVPAALTATVIWGMVSPVPSYLTTWSRFPFAAMLTLLPIAIEITLMALEDLKPGLLMLSALSVLGLGLIHYGGLLLWGTFLVIHLIMTSKGDWLGKIGWLLVLLAPLMLVLGIRLTNPSVLVQMIEQISHTTTTTNEFLDVAYIWKVCLHQGGSWVFIGAAIGVLTTSQQNRRMLGLLCGWTMLSGLLSWGLAWLSSWGSGSMVNWLLALFLPLSVLAGWGLARLLVSPLIEKAIWSQRMTVIMLIAVAASSAFVMSARINPATVLFSTEDAGAMGWIALNTSPEDQFLVNSFIWGGTYVPSDGGGWIRAFTGRQIDFVDNATESTDLVTLTCDRDTEYVYFGRRSGLLDRNMFLSEPSLFTPVYENGQVEIFYIKCDKH